MKSGLHPVAFFDSPKVLDCNVTAIPGSGSSPLQVVASLPSDVQALECLGATGQYIGVYEGAIGSEVLKTIVADFIHKREVYLRKGSRISLRSMDTATITSGTLCCQFMNFTAHT